MSEARKPFPSWDDEEEPKRRTPEDIEQFAIDFREKAENARAQNPLMATTLQLLDLGIQRDRKNATLRPSYAYRRMFMPVNTVEDTLFVATRDTWVQGFEIGKPPILEGAVIDDNLKLKIRINNDAGSQYNEFVIPHLKVNTIIISPNGYMEGVSYALNRLPLSEENTADLNRDLERYIEPLKLRTSLLDRLPND